jgi:hypothetical protein
VIHGHLMNLWRLTTPHKLQGRGSVGKPDPGRMGCLRPEKTDGRALAASCGS